MKNTDTVSVGSSIPLAWALLIASFFLPTIAAGGNVDSGAAAFTSALVFGGIYGAVSALTNIVFLSSAIVFFRRKRRVVRVLFLLVTFSFAVNAWWLVRSLGSDLRIGYYVWLSAFAVLAVGLYTLLRSSPDPDLIDSPEPLTDQ
ncbi:MAG: hypothetical protein HKN13_12165 [Rhodothermales bacterium]|nr:hypothetical protein [Rhodothermales bacterium]